MVQFRDGQCGVCVHFGEGSTDNQPKLMQMRATHKGPDDLIERCGLPENAQLHLRVTPVSGCDGFARAEEEQLHVSPQET